MAYKKQYNTQRDSNARDPYREHYEEKEYINHRDRNRADGDMDRARSSTNDKYYTGDSRRGRDNHNRGERNYNRGGYVNSEAEESGGWQREQRANTYGTNRNNNMAATPKQPETIDIKKYEAENDDEAKELLKPIEKFEEVIGDEILHGIYSYGFEYPSPIQSRAIRPFIHGRDLIAQAQSGTGKTATFIIALLSKLDMTLSKPQGIILAPTAELAQQIATVAKNLGNYMTGLKISLAYKGIGVRENIEEMQQDPHIIVGTPGRILDMLNNAIDYRHLKYLILDEADKLLSREFTTQIREIFKYLVSDAQVGLYTATVDTNFFEITKKFMRNPVYLLVGAEKLTLDGIKQYKIYMDGQYNDLNNIKYDTLCDLYSILKVNQIIIYCNTQRNVADLYSRLTQDNFTVGMIHGYMQYNEREDVLGQFRKGSIRVLLSTDLLCRGIDIQQISVVINYDLPKKMDSYLHRIGRSGRYGRKGVAINFVSKFDVRNLENIEQFYKIKIDDLPENVANLLD